MWGRAIENGKPGTSVRISTAAGSDIDAVAATDSQGRVWVAWQGWRNGKAAIFAATQNGNEIFSAGHRQRLLGQRMESCHRCRWDRTRHRRLGFLSQRKLRRLHAHRQMPARGARKRRWPRRLAMKHILPSPTIRRDACGSPTKKAASAGAKDFGAYDTTGLALYQGRAVRLVGFDRDGRVLRTAADPGTVLPGIAAVRVDLRRSHRATPAING